MILCLALQQAIRSVTGRPAGLLRLLSGSGFADGRFGGEPPASIMVDGGSLNCMGEPSGRLGATFSAKRRLAKFPGGYPDMAGVNYESGKKTESGYGSYLGRQIRQLRAG